MIEPIQAMQATTALLGVVIGAAGIIKSAPLVRRMTDLAKEKSQLLRERDMSTAESAVVRAMANSWHAAHDALRAELVAVQESIASMQQSLIKERDARRLMEDSLQIEKAHVAVLGARLDVLAPKFLASLRYIHDLHAFIAQITGRARVAGADLGELHCPAVPVALGEDLSQQGPPKIEG